MPSSDLVHLHDYRPRTGMLAKWDRIRHRQAHWLVECIAEATGGFLYCFAGGSVGAAFFLGNLAQVPLSSLLGVGFGYMVGIILAVVVCSGTSGGHFNPCMTITFVVFHKFPVLKAVRYIIAQILGAYIAFGFIYLQYRPFIMEVEAGLVAKHLWDTTAFTSQGVVGIFALFAPAGYPLGTVLLNEFVVDFVLAVVIFACTDPTNLLVPPAAAPFIIAFAYGVAIWGFSFNGLAANTARDLGGRLFALTVYGHRASGGAYAAIAALTNIPATLLGCLFYQVVLADGQRVMNPEQKLFLDAHAAHASRRERIMSGDDMEVYEDRSSDKVPV